MSRDTKMSRTSEREDDWVSFCADCAFGIPTNSTSRIFLYRIAPPRKRCGFDRPHRSDRGNADGIRSDANVSDNAFAGDRAATHKLVGMCCHALRETAFISFQCRIVDLSAHRTDSPWRGRGHRRDPGSLLIRRRSSRQRTIARRKQSRLGSGATPADVDLVSLVIDGFRTGSAGFSEQTALESSERDTPRDRK